MSRDEPKVEFSGTFTAGSMQIAGRDMTVNASTEGRIGEVNQRLADVAMIRESLRAIPLTEDDRMAATNALGALEEELSKPEPDAPRAATALEALTTIVKAAGGLAIAGATLIDPIGRLAVAFGGAAASVLRAIGR